MLTTCKSLLYQPKQKSSEISKIEDIFGKLPQGSEIKEATTAYCIFITIENKTENLGFQTVRFKVEACYLEGNPNDDRGNNEVPSEMTLAMRYNDKIVIIEGRHRAIHAFQGGTVLPNLGGILEKPNILEYLFDPGEAPQDNFFEEMVPISNFKNYINPYKY